MGALFSENKKDDWGYKSVFEFCIQDSFFKTNQQVVEPNFGSYSVLGFYVVLRRRHVRSCELLLSTVYQGFENYGKDIR